MPSSGQAMHTASDAVPVAGTPASHRACALASVTVITALTMAARDRRSGTMPTMLIVPGPGAEGSRRLVGSRRPRRHGDTDRRVDLRAAVLVAPHRAKVDGGEHADSGTGEPALECQLGQVRLGIDAARRQWGTWALITQ